MTALASTLHQLVTEQQSHDQFYGLFVYNGNVGQPPANAEPTLKLMQLQDAWIAFSDDRETDDCSACKPPFTQCSAEVGFCHLRFPLNQQGTQQAVQTLVDLAEQPSTAFVVEYSIDDVQQQGDGMNARSIMRFPLHGNDGKDGTQQQQQQQGKGGVCDTDGGECSKGGGYRMWMTGALILLVIVSVVVAVVMYQRSQKPSPEQNKQQEMETKYRRRRTTLSD